MAKSLPNLRSLPRWRDFVIRYRGDINRFFIEVLGIKPTWQQWLINDAVVQLDSRVAVPSGHGSGKSLTFAGIALWHLLCFPKSNTMITATNITQVSAAIWKEMADHQDRIERRFPWLTPYIIIKQKLAYIYGYKMQWFILPKTASKAAPENIAGMHRKYYLIMADEASGIDDTVLNVLKGGLTGGEPGSVNRFMMASQPTRTTGHFAEAITTLRKTPENPKGIYEVIELNAEESPIVSRNKIREWLIEYGGHHNPQYQIKVLGRIPAMLSGYAIPRHWLEDARYNHIEHDEPWGWVLTVDVAEGKHRDSSTWTLAKVSGMGVSKKADIIEQYETASLDEMVFAREVHNKALHYSNITVAVDGDGPGRTVILHLREQGMNVQEIRWGYPCHAKRDRELYKNLRAKATFDIREMLIDGRMKLGPNPKTIDQGCRIPYKINDKGQYQIWSKDKMKTEGIKSPDLFDTVCFLSLSNFIPVSEEAGPEDGGVDWDEMMSEMFKKTA